MDRKIRRKRGRGYGVLRSRERRKHEREREKARRRNGKNEEEKKDLVVIEGRKEGRERIRCVVSGQAAPHSPTHKVDKKEKDRAAMRLWFTPHRMTDPLSGTSFNMLMDERTNVDYHRSCIAPRR